jgi:adenosine kinase
MVILSPDGKDSTILHANEMHNKGIPIMYDPGQGLPMFDKSEILNFIDQAEWIILNEYEANLLSEITGLDHNEIKAKVSAMIVTKGGQGSDIYVEDQVISIDPIPVENEADPTGCGDAYRAGLIYGIINDLGWEKSGKLGSILGSIKVQSHGTQNHVFELEALLSRL